MLEISQLSKRYGERDVLKGVSFTVKPGEAVAYLGPNGAGKSTTVKIVAGLIRPGGGSVKVCGHDVAAEPLAAKQRLGYVPDSAALYETLTPNEYLSLVAELHHMERGVAAERITKMLGAFELAPHADRPAETLSRGQRQKVLITAALVHDPDLLLLDEPLNGLDANSGMALRTILESLVQRGKSIVFCTHIFEIVQRLCQRVVVIADGTIVADDATETFLKRIPGGTVEAVFRQLTKPEQADEGAREFIKALAGGKG